jgi:hypothetical protein
VDCKPSGDVVSTTVEAHNGITLLGDPLQRLLEFSGLFFRQLDLITNKRVLALSRSLAVRAAATRRILSTTVLHVARELCPRWTAIGIC